jgi:copper(I)-binding protein
LKAPLNADESYRVTLVFEKAGKVKLTGLAKRPADLKMPSSHSSDAHSSDAHSSDAHSSGSHSSGSHSMDMPKSN